MKQSDSIKELATALSGFQGEITSVSKDSVNPFFKMKYASLNSIWEHIRKPLAKCGLSVVQGGEPVLSDDHVVINTLLLHTSGEWILSSLPIKPVKDDPQGIGSAITYARRYGLSAMLGLVADEDDDGEGAQARQIEKKASQKVEQKATPPPTPEAPQSISSPPEEVEYTYPPLESIGGLLNRGAEYGISKEDIMEVVSKATGQVITKQQDIKDYDTAWALVAVKFAKTIQAVKDAN